MLISRIREISEPVDSGRRGRRRSPPRCRASSEPDSYPALAWESFLAGSWERRALGVGEHRPAPLDGKVEYREHDDPRKHGGRDRKAARLGQPGEHAKAQVDEKNPAGDLRVGAPRLDQPLVCVRAVRLMPRARREPSGAAR